MQAAFDAIFCCNFHCDFYHACAATSDCMCKPAVYVSVIWSWLQHNIAEGFILVMKMTPALFTTRVHHNMFKNGVGVVRS